jgi:hypothetical protein
MMRMTPQNLCTVLFKLTVSIALAFPLCGITYGLIGLLRAPIILFKDPLGTLFAIAVGSLWFGIGTVATGGFPWGDEAGTQRVNMYPYIVLTACIIFFLLSKGWRRFLNNDEAIR